MALDYDTYVSQLANLMVVGSTDANFQTFLPGCIDYAENRIYRELDLLTTRITDSTAVSSGNRNFTLPSNNGTFLVVEGINIITPSGLSITSSGSRNPVVFTSREFIDVCYPSNSVVTGVPEYAAMINPTQVIFGPAPASPYTAEVIGTYRPTALSSGNSSTWVTQNLPDLFIAASMVFASAYQRDFSLAGDNPQQGQTWEAQYGTLRNSANTLELRKRYQSQGWTDKTPNPIATPPRV
jgi:hypothetical protein